LKDTKGVKIVVCNIKLPTNEIKILNTIEKCYQSNSITFSVFDHIAPFPTLIFPVKKLIQMAKKYNSISVIDGAHAVGQLPLNISDLDPDFYFSSCHKWLMANKGTAFLYVAKKYQSIMHPLQITHWYKQGFKTEFRFIGTRDYTPLIAIKKTLEFRNWVNDTIIKQYNNNLCNQVGLALI
jgi:hercynylcysteine S-oxide lyase